MTRDPSHARSLRLRSRHANLSPIALDYASPHSVASALRGVRRVFLNTRAQPDDARRLSALLAHSAAASLELAVKLSSAEAEEPFGAAHRREEAAVRHSGLPHVVLRPTTLMDNVLDDAARLYCVKGGQLRLPSGGALVAHVDLRDVGEAAAKLLTLPAQQLQPYLGRTFTMTGGQPATLPRVCELLSAAAGQRVEHADVSWPQYEAELRERHVPALLVQSYVLPLARWFAVGGRAAVESGVEQLLDRPPRV